MRAVRLNVKPRQHRELVVEKINLVYDWKAFFADLKVNMSGHVQTKNMKSRGAEACHVWHFVRRESLSGGLETQVEDSFGLPPDANDIILLVKYHLSNLQISLVLP